jgi:hypothetical protein
VDYIKKHSLTVSLLALSLVLLQSCASIKYSTSRESVNLENNLSVLNGDYVNYNTDSNFSNVSFWSVLTKNYNRPGFSEGYNISNSFVRLTAKYDRVFSAQLYIDSVVSEEKKLKGKIKSNKFILRRKVTLYGLPMIFLWYSDYQLQLSSDSGSTLFVDGINGRATWVLLFTGGSHDAYNFKFQRRL